MLRKNDLSINEFYHIYNRGVDKRVIFNTPHDYRRFQALLYLSNNTDAIDMRRIIQKGESFEKIFNTEKSDTLVDIGAYCLMPNHFHILIYEKSEDGISQFMKKIATAYSMYFNKKNERSGTLFEGPFKSELVDSDEYFNYLFSYIHLNPVSLIDSKWKEEGISDIQKIVDYINGYTFSSHKDYFGKNRPESKIVNKEVFPEHFLQLNSTQELIDMWSEGQLFSD